MRVARVSMQSYTGKHYMVKRRWYWASLTNKGHVNSREFLSSHSRAS
jgi:hypothetical protein